MNNLNTCHFEIDWNYDSVFTFTYQQLVETLIDHLVPHLPQHVGHLFRMFHSKGIVFTFLPLFIYHNKNPSCSFFESFVHSIPVNIPFLSVLAGMACVSLWSSALGRTVKPSSASPNATCCSAPSPCLWPTVAGESLSEFRGHADKFSHIHANTSAGHSNNNDSRYDKSIWFTH